MRRAVAIGPGFGALLSFLIAAPGAAQLVEVVLAPDVALALPGLEGPLLDREAERERTMGSPGRTRLSELPALPDGIALAAIDFDPGGRLIFALDGWAELPGAGLVGPADVVARSGNTFTVVFDGEIAGVPPGAAIDALVQTAPSQILLSFDIAIQGPGFVIDDEDFVSATNNAIEFYFDLSELFPAGLDLDGLSYIVVGSDDYIAMSLDGSGQVGGVSFDDEDILGWDLPDWVMLYDAALASPAWQDVNLAAFDLLEAPIFSDDFESGDTGAWSATVP